MKRGASRILVTLAVASGVVSLVDAGPAAAQGEPPQQVHSPLYGLTVEWGQQWSASEIDEDGGAVWLVLEGEHGQITLWAAPAFGGNESLCLEDVGRRLEADPLVSDLQPAPGSAPVLVPDAETALFQMRFQPAGGAAVPWRHAAWCRTLQTGYSILQVEVHGDTSEFDLALTALADVTITTTANLPPPEFPYDAERDDLTSFWSQQFAAWGLEPYIPPTYVSFTDQVSSACGPMNPLDIGFVYCTADNAVFVDVAAADDLGTRYGRGINVFLLGHETGHHAAWLLGYTELCELSECLDEINDVQWELMADCFAGAWMANAHERGILTMDDVEDVLVGVADSFSDSGHGTSALRLWWLLQGFHAGADVCFQPEEQ